MYEYIHSPLRVRELESAQMLMYVCMYVCIHIHKHVFVHTITCVHAYEHVSGICACMFAWVHVYQQDMVPVCLTFHKIQAPITAREARAQTFIESVHTMSGMSQLIF